MKKSYSTLLPLLLLSSCSISLPTLPNNGSSNSPISSNTPIVSSDVGSGSSSSSSSPIPSSSSEEPIVEDPDYAPEGYSLTWSDEFDGSSLNMANWEYEIGNGSGGWGNQEAQYYTDHNDKVEDGKLVISAKRETVENWGYTSTRIRSKGKVATTYGYICARIKLAAVKGLWPAFWMLPETGYGDSGVTWWPTSGEIDIMENKGRDASHTSSALHYASDGTGGNHTYQTASASVGNIEEYHVYAVEWTETVFRFSVDGNVHLSRPRGSWNVGYGGSGNAPFNKDFHLLINMAVGGQFDNYVVPPDEWRQSDMFVDYVRIYNNPNAD